MSYYEDLLSKGATKEEIRDDLLENNSDAIKSLYEKGATNDEVFGLLEEDYGIPTSVVTGEDNQSEGSYKVQDTNDKPIKTQEEISLEEKTKDNKYLTFDTVKDAMVSSAMSIPSSLAVIAKAGVDAIQDDRTNEEKRIGEVVAKSEQLSGTSSIRYLMSNSIHNKDGEVSRKDEAFKRAVDFLYKEGTIENYSTKDRIVKLKDGREIPFESSFMDSIIASKYETGLSLAFSLSFPAWSKYLKAAETGSKFSQGMVKATEVTGASAVGSGYGASIDKLHNAKFFGESLDNEDIATAAIDAAYDDVLFGGVIESLVYAGKLGGGKLMELGRDVKEKVLGLNYEEALGLLRKHSALDDDEFDSLLDTASVFWDEKRLGLDTKEGQKQAIRWMAQYDSSLASHVEQANSSGAVSNMLKQMVSRTAILKNGIKNEGIEVSNIAREIDSLKVSASKNYDAMTKNLDEATKYADIDSSFLKSNLVGTMRALDETEGVFAEKSLRQLNNFRIKASKVSTLGSVAKLYRSYNSFLRGVDLNSLDKDNRKALLNGKKHIKNFLEHSINTMDYATKKEKKSLFKSFNEANNAYKTVMSAIDTDLYDSIVSKRGIVSNPNKELIDSLVSSAKKSYLGVDIDETSKIINMLPADKATKVENAIMERIVSKNMLEREGKISDFKYITEELKSIKHIFKSDDNVKTLSNLSYFSKLWENDENMLQFISKNADEGQLSGAGISKSLVESAKYATNSRLFMNMQRLIPSILKKIPIVKGVTDAGVLKDWKNAAENKNIKAVINEQLSQSKDMPDFVNRVFSEIPKLEKSSTGISLKNLINTYMKRNQEIDEAFPRMRENMEYDNHIVDSTKLNVVDNANKNNIQTDEVIIPEDLYINNVRRMKRNRVNVTSDNAESYINNLIHRTGATRDYSLKNNGSKVSISDSDGNVLGSVNFKDVHSNEAIARQVHAIFSNIPRKVVPETPALDNSIRTSMRNINNTKGASSYIGNNGGNTVVIEQGGGRGEFTFRPNGIISGYTMGARQGTNSGSKIYKTLWDAIDGTAHKYKAGNDLTNSNTFRMTANQLQYMSRRQSDAPNIILNGIVQKGVPSSLDGEPLTMDNAKTVANGFKTFFNRMLPKGVNITSNTTDEQLKGMVQEYGSRQDRKFGLKTAKLIRNFARTGNLTAMASILTVLSNQKDIINMLDNIDEDEGKKKDKGAI